MDVHVRRAVSVALLERGVDVLTAQADGTTKLADPALLDRASELGRLFSPDEDLLSEAVRRQHPAVPFAGVVYAHQLYVPIGQCINDLELIAKVGESEDVSNRVQFLPL